MNHLLYMNLIKSFFTILFVLSAMALFAQKDKNLPTENVEVIKNFDARLLDAEKLKINPVLPPLDTTTQKQKYDIPARSIQIEYLPPKLRPIAIKAEKMDPAYNGFAKAGYGIPNSPYLEASYTYVKPKSFDIGAFVKHHSAKLSSDTYQRFSHTLGGLEGTYYMDNGLAAGGLISYGNDRYSYYGYDKTRDSLTEEEAKQSFSVFDLKARVFNGERTEGDFNYSGEIDYYRLRDNYATLENGFNIKLDGTKWFDEKHPLRVTLQTDFTSLKDTFVEKHTLNNIYLQPNFTYHGDFFVVKAGINLISHKDEFFIKPDLEASINVAGSKLAVFAGWKGDFKKNTYRSVSDYCPYVKPYFEPKNNNVNEYFGGIKGNLGILEYNGKVSYSNNKGLALFVTDSSDIRRRLDVVYDTVTIFNISGGVTAHPFEGLDILITLSQNIFDPKQNEKAWGLPSTDINFGVRYSLMNNSLRLKADLSLQDGVPYKVGTKTGKLNALLDISAGAEYWFIKNVGAFIELNNLANVKWERFYKYPTYGTNILGGITARF